MSGIAVAGSVLVDKINRIKRFPKESELIEIEEISSSVGGCVPNVAVDIRKIAEEIPVFAYGKVGKDADGEYVKASLKNAGANISGLTYSEDNTSKTEVMSVAGGQRTFFTYAGASKDFGLCDIDFDGAEFSMLHLGYFLLLKKVDGGDGLKILKAAKDRGIKTSIDLVSQPSESYEHIVECLKYTDNLIINEVESGFLTGIEPRKENFAEISEKLLSFGVKERVIIHLPELAVLRTEDKYIVMPSYEFPKERIAGTTGAGDAFCAGALVGIYKGYTDEEILSLASGAAVTSLLKADATSGVKSEKEINGYCKNFKRKKICL